MWVVRHWNKLPREAGSIQGPVGWDSEQPGLVKDVPARGRGIDLDD